MLMNASPFAWTIVIVSDPTSQLRGGASQFRHTPDPVNAMPIEKTRISQDSRNMQQFCIRDAWRRNLSCSSPFERSAMPSWALDAADAAQAFASVDVMASVELRP
jgi:hypothetical protein